MALSPPQKYNQNISNRINAETTTKEHPTGHLPVAFGYEGGWFLLGLGGLGGGQGWVEVFCRLHACTLSEN